tara:strand:- start:558 stop:1760 length:1203 start_codon:yes stop_codon:yes gene_type:complete
MKKRILIISECFYPEEFNINSLALTWVEKGYKVDVLTLIPTYPKGKVISGYNNRLVSKELYKNILIYRIFAITGYKNNKVLKILKYINFMFLGSIVAVCIGKKYDYIFGFNLGSLTDMFPAVLIKKLYKKPLMLWVQDLWPESVYAYGFNNTKILSTSLNWFVKYIFHNVSTIAISGQGFEKKLMPYAKTNLSMTYLPNWAIDLEDADSSKDFSLSHKPKTHFTFTGNIGRIQNLSNIIKAFESMPNEYLNKSQLNIVGDGSYLNELKTISKANKQIKFHGMQKRNLMSKFYKASDFLIVSLIDNPIYSVHVPAKTQTYIAAKKPILAIINGETADIVRDNNLGLCGNPSDVDSICKLFVKCINMSDDQRQEFVKNNDELLNNIFNKEKIINKLTHLLIK